MPTASIRKGFSRVTVNDQGSSTRVVELVCKDHASEEAVLSYLETQGYKIGNGTKWRTESISVAPSPLSLPANSVPGMSTGDPDRVVYFATVQQSLVSPELILGSTFNTSGDRLLAGRDLAQVGGTRVATLMKEWPTATSDLPLDPWHVSGEDIRVDKSLKPLDVNGQPIRRPVPQMSYTITELRKGNFLDFDIRNARDLQGTRNEFDIAGLAAGAGELLFQSVSASRLNSSMTRVTFQFLWDAYRHLDMEPISPLAGQTGEYREESPNNSTAIETGVTAGAVYHLRAMWVARNRAANWTLDDFGISNTYYLKLITGSSGP